MLCGGLMELFHLDIKFIFDELISSGCAERISVSAVHDGARV